MSIVRGVRKLLKSDFPESPEWFTNFLGTFNQFLDSVIGALRGRLTFRDNFYCEVKEFEFVHATELKITHALQNFEGLLIVKTPGDTPATTYGISEYHTRIIDNKNIGVTIEFAAATDADGDTTTGSVKFIILG